MILIKQLNILQHFIQYILIITNNNSPTEDDLQMLKDSNKLRINYDGVNDFVNLKTRRFKLTNLTIGENVFYYDDRYKIEMELFLTLTLMVM